jgi:ribosomal-protein-alanine N-acetyltransferase
MPKKKTVCHVRWMRIEDLKQVVEIESLANDYREKLTESDFRHYLGSQKYIGMVAELNGEVVGFMLYGLQIGFINLITLATHPKFQQSGIGRLLMQMLIRKLNWQNRHKIVIDIDERNLVAQLFLKSCEFRAEDLWKCEKAELTFYHFIYRAKRES